MNGLDTTKTATVYIEISQEAFRCVHREQGFEVALLRQENGSLSAACKENLVTTLKSFLKRASWQPRLKALCAIGSRGVSFRRVQLPSGAREDLPRFLYFQIEREFPVSAEELSWGYKHLPAREKSTNETADSIELLVLAVKK